MEGDGRGELPLTRPPFPETHTTGQRAAPNRASINGTYLLDRNCQAFDIGNVLGAFNFATFQANLGHIHAPELLSKFEESKLALLKKLRDDKNNASLKWKYSHQMAQKEFKDAKENAKDEDKRRREQ